MQEPAQLVQMAEPLQQAQLRSQIVHAQQTPIWTLALALLVQIAEHPPLGLL